MTQLQIYTTDDWKSEIVREKDLVLVDFQAPWCTSALLQYDALMKLANEVKGDVKMFYLDVSQLMSIAMTYRLIDFPTLSLFKKGEILKSCIGINRIGEMRLILDEALLTCDK
jgi:thioredoxin 1